MSAAVEAVESTVVVTPEVAVVKAPADEAEEDGDEGGGDAAPEEEATAVFKPLVDLAEIDVVSGEEHEETLFKLRGKLYRYTEVNCIQKDFSCSHRLLCAPTVEMYRRSSKRDRGRNRCV
jgi:hypothetical protein